MMKTGITLIALVCLTAPLMSKDYNPNSTEEALVQRTMSLTGNPKGLLCIVHKPGLLSGADFTAKMAASVTKGVAYATSQHKPIIIYSSDPTYTTKVIQLAFAPIRKNSLRGTAVICAVGQENASQIRPVVTATGAKLYVEPMP